MSRLTDTVRHRQYGVRSTQYSTRRGSQLSCGPLGPRDPFGSRTLILDYCSYQFNQSRDPSSNHLYGLRYSNLQTVFPMFSYTGTGVVVWKNGRSRPICAAPPEARAEAQAEASGHSGVVCSSTACRGRCRRRAVRQQPYRAQRGFEKFFVRANSACAFRLGCLCCGYGEAATRASRPRWIDCTGSEVAKVGGRPRSSHQHRD